MIRYDTRSYFNVRSKADISQLNLPHETKLKKWKRKKKDRKNRPHRRCFSRITLSISTAGMFHIERTLSRAGSGQGPMLPWAYSRPCPE